MAVVLGVGFALRIGVALGVGFALSMGVALGVGVALRIGVALGGGVALGVGVALSVGVTLGMGMGMGMGSGARGTVSSSVAIGMSTRGGGVVARLRVHGVGSGADWGAARCSGVRGCSGIAVDFAVTARTALSLAYISAAAMAARNSSTVRDA